MRELPLTATNKIHRVGPRRTFFLCPNPAWWRPTPMPPYEPLTGVALDALHTHHTRHARRQASP